MADQWIDQLTQWVENNREQWLGQEDIVTASGVSDLSAYIKSFVQSYSDISAEFNLVYSSDMPSSIHGLDTRDLGGIIYSWSISDIKGIIDTHLPIDLQSTLNVIEIRDLSSSITGEWIHGYGDIGAEFYRIWNRGYKNLQALLHGWSTKDLPSYINPVYYADLGASLKGSLFRDLAATVSLILPSNLQGLIHGFDTFDLPALLNGGYGPNDLQAYINIVTPSDLAAYIVVYKGIQVPYDLLALIVGGYSMDLPAYMGGILPINLPAYLNPVLKALDLNASIIPSTILMKRAIQIPLLEYKDLTAIVNFMCFGSAYKDLSAYTYALHKMDLSAHIISWFGGTADNLKDLGAYINTAIYDTQDKITLSYVPEPFKYTRLTLSFGVTDTYTTWDTLGLEFATYYTRDLMSSINGILQSVNLGASLTATWDWNYSQLPDYVKPKTHEVFINIEKFEEQWCKFIEIMFDKDGTSSFKYFYVSGTEQVYKVDRSRHWTIWAEGYNKVDNSLIEKANTRKKFIFRMSDYSTIDEAIRDLMERAAHPSTANLSAFIDGGPTIHSDMTASITSIDKPHRWVKHLRAQINGI